MPGRSGRDEMQDVDPIQAALNRQAAREASQAAAEKTPPSAATPPPAPKPAPAPTGIRGAAQTLKDAPSALDKAIADAGG